MQFAFCASASTVFCFYFFCISQLLSFGRLFSSSLLSTSSLFFWIVTSSFQFCFSSENFHVSFFLLNFITQILSFHSKFCKRKMRVIQMKWQILWEWKRRNAIEKNVCVFYFVCGIYFYVLSGCLTCILHCLYVFECECFASSFLRLSVSVCLCCGTMKSRALVFKRLLKVKRVCDQRKKSIENHHTTATTAAVKHTHTHSNNKCDGMHYASAIIVMETT